MLMEVTRCDDQWDEARLRQRRWVSQNEAQGLLNRGPSKPAWKQLGTGSNIPTWPDLVNGEAYSARRSVVPGSRDRSRVRPATSPPIDGGLPVAMFAEVNALPSSEGQTSCSDRDDEGGSEQRRLYVGRHVIGAFQRVLIGEILRSQGVAQGLQIVSNLRRSVFVDRQRCRSVLDKQVKKADIEPFRFRADFPGCSGDQVKSLGRNGGNVMMR